MHHIAEDDPEAWFWGLIGDDRERAPAGLLVDLREPKRVRTVLFDVRRHLSLKHTEMLKRPLDLGLRRGEIERHRQPLLLEEHDAAQAEEAADGEDAHGV